MAQRNQATSTRGVMGKLMNVVANGCDIIRVLFPDPAFFKHEV